MKSLLIFGLASVIIFSCTREKLTYSTTIAKNNSNHTITIVPYSSGQIQTIDSYSISPLLEKEILGIRNGGIGSGVSYGTLIQYADSIIVIFDGIYAISHYKPKPLGSSIKHYTYTSKRNLFNDSNYQSVITSDNSGVRNWKFTYTFTEQDYLDAK